jgi:hypothetical protein
MASFLEQLKELRYLRADGKITNAEFISLKQQVMSLTAPPFAVAPSASSSSAVDLTLTNFSQTSTPSTRLGFGLSSGKKEMTADVSQTTLHKYSGPSRIASSSGAIFLSAACLQTTQSRFRVRCAAKNAKPTKP